MKAVMITFWNGCDRCGIFDGTERKVVSAPKGSGQ
jgi:hypothetical protein